MASPRNRVTMLDSTDASLRLAKSTKSSTSMGDDWFTANSLDDGSASGIGGSSCVVTSTWNAPLAAAPPTENDRLGAAAGPTLVMTPGTHSGRPHTWGHATALNTKADNDNHPNKKCTATHLWRQPICSVRGATGVFVVRVGDPHLDTRLQMLHGQQVFFGAASSVRRSAGSSPRAGPGSGSWSRAASGCACGSPGAAGTASGRPGPESTHGGGSPCRQKQQERQEET